MVLKANWSKITQRAKQLAKSQNRSRSEFLKLDKDNLTAHLRLALFEGADGDGELDIEYGTHFGLDDFGATERYTKDGKTDTRDVKAAKCSAITHAQYQNEELAELLRALGQDRGYVCSPEEIKLLSEHCIFCAMAESFVASDDPAERKVGYRLRANRKFLMNAVDRSADGDGKYVIFEAGPSVYNDIMLTMMNPHYEGRILGCEEAHEFEISLKITPTKGRRPRYEYSVQVLPERTPLGDPTGKVVNLGDPGWRDNLLFAWDVEAQKEILNGGTVERPKRDDADPDVPKPRCYNQAMKDMATAQCKQCAWAKKCDSGEVEEDKPAAKKVSIADRGRAFSQLLSGRKSKATTKPKAEPKPVEKAPEPAPAAPEPVVEPEPAPEPEKAPEPAPDPTKKAAAPAKKTAGKMSVLDRLKAAKASRN